ncbi:hypothetical protein GIB67_018336 [Kingdonia uniflora]|uniref:Alcohol dehydrogenase n=1 Tax=Kingdonia uniflora TaxID=39325 RepID=A0A7J7MJ14_9MAGN|nr:hypothetical protein GIB67_018336 [Kingdonia uniflora]
MTNRGVDRSVECTRSIAAMISAFECVHDVIPYSHLLVFSLLHLKPILTRLVKSAMLLWGVAVLVGVLNKDDAFKTHPMNILNERTLKGAFFGNCKPRSDISTIVKKYMNKEIELEKFITHEVHFSEINKAFDYMVKGESFRCIIRMDG